MGDRHADRAASLALRADARRGDLGTAAGQLGADHLEQLVLVDRAAAQLEVNSDMLGDRRGGGERRDVLGLRVDERDEVVDAGVVAQCLDAACCRACPDRDQAPRNASHLLDPLAVFFGRDRSLHQREVVGTADGRAGGLGEVGDLDLAGQRQKLVLAIEQRELAAIAGGELPDGKLRLPARRGLHSSRTPMSGSSLS